MTEIHFKGVRGSFPVPGPSTAKYGGNTTCVYIKGENTHLIVDGGTGLIGLSEELPKEGEFNILLTHHHWDHIQGLPYFRQLLSPDCVVNLYTADGSLDVLTEQMKHPVFPLTTDDIKAKLTAHRNSEVRRIGEFEVRPFSLNHPGGATGYRIDANDGSIGCVWDHEIESEMTDARIVMAVRGVDHLIHDAYCTTDEYFGVGCEPKKGWGHSTNVQAGAIATLSKVGKLHLTHYSPNHDDEKLEDILAETRIMFRNTDLAREGIVVDLSQSRVEKDIA